jgi:threonine synthase
MALDVKQESNGEFNSVTDEEILAAYRILAGEEGVFCEPSSAASVAGLLVHGLPTDLANTTPTVVCTLTGHGLKDPATALGEIEAGRIASTSRVAADYESIRKLIDA